MTRPRSAQDLHALAVASILPRVSRIPGIAEIGAAFMPNA
jgi:hypothetical protein